MGEDVYTPGKDGDGLRSLSNPEKYNQPANMVIIIKAQTMKAAYISIVVSLIKPLI